MNLLSCVYGVNVVRRTHDSTGAQRIILGQPGLQAAPPHQLPPAHRDGWQRSHANDKTADGFANMRFGASKQPSHIRDTEYFWILEHTGTSVKSGLKRYRRIRRTRCTVPALHLPH